jgi:hypothetical protein
MITVMMKKISKGQPIPPEIEDELFSRCLAIEPPTWLDFDGSLGVFAFDSEDGLINPAQARVDFVAVTIDVSDGEEDVISEIDNLGWEVLLEDMEDTFLEFYKKHGETPFNVVPVWENEREYLDGWEIASYYILVNFEEPIETK